MDQGNERRRILTITTGLPPNPLVGVVPLAPTEQNRLQTDEARLASASLVGKAKTWSWRLTGLAIWLGFTDYCFGSGQLVSAFPRVLLQAVAELLAHSGFAPTNPSQFSAVAKTCWIILITGCRAVEIVGLLIYLLLFPVVILCLLVFRKKLRAQVPPRPPGGELRRLRAAFGRIRFRALLVLMLFAWFALYGDASNGTVLLVGMVPAALLFGLLIYRALARARPREVSSGLGNYLAGTWVLEAAKKEAPLPNHSWMLLWLYQPMRKLYRRAAVCIRRWRAPQRAWVIVMAGFVAWPLLLVAAAAGFWGLALKYAVSPVSISWSEALQAALSLFLPSVRSPSTLPSIPVWVAAGGNLTAVLLLVIYLAVAGSFVPRRQTYLVEQFARWYVPLRWNALKAGLMVRWLENCDRLSQGPSSGGAIGSH